MQINGAELSYVTWGEGDPVVFVHGSVGDYRDWLEVLGPFAARYRVVAVSRRGTSRTPGLRMTASACRRFMPLTLPR